MKKNILAFFACTLFLAQLSHASFFTKTRKLRTIQRRWKKFSNYKKYALPSLISGGLFVWALINKKAPGMHPPHYPYPQNNSMQNTVEATPIPAQTAQEMQGELFNQILLERDFPLSPEALDVILGILANEIIISSTPEEEDIPYAPVVGSTEQGGYEFLNHPLWMPYRSPLSPPLAEPNFGPMQERTFNTWRHLNPATIDRLLDRLKDHYNTDYPIIGNLIMDAKNEINSFKNNWPFNHRKQFIESLVSYLEEQQAALQQGERLPACLICAEHIITDLPQAWVRCPNCNQPYHHECAGRWEHVGQGARGCPHCRNHVEYRNIPPARHLSTAIIPFVHPHP